MKTFTLLQALDVMTTLVGLHLGLVEAMTVPARLIGRTSPLLGLVACKLVAFALAGMAILLRRRVTLFNRWFSVVIAWNFALISGRIAGVC